MHLDDDDVKVGTRFLPLDHPLVAEVLVREAESRWGSIMIHEKSRLGRSHLRVHRDRRGAYYIRVGRRGSCKQTLGRCEVTYIDGEPSLFQFTTQASDEFEADQQRRWDAKYGIEA